MHDTPRPASSATSDSNQRVFPACAFARFPWVADRAPCPRTHRQQIRLRSHRWKCDQLTPDRKWSKHAPDGFLSILQYGRRQRRENIIETLREFKHPLDEKPIFQVDALVLAEPGMIAEWGRTGMAIPPLTMASYLEGIVPPHLYALVRNATTSPLEAPSQQEPSKGRLLQWDMETRHQDLKVLTPIQASTLVRSC